MVNSKIRLASAGKNSKGGVVAVTMDTTLIDTPITQQKVMMKLLRSKACRRLGAFTFTGTAMTVDPEAL
jgi:hypothetical protein